MRQPDRDFAQLATLPSARRRSTLPGVAPV
jgi:hypothetical protein